MKTYNYTDDSFVQAYRRGIRGVRGHPTFEPTPTMKTYNYTIHDLLEGDITGSIKAESEVEAYEEAQIAAAENGCTHVDEIIVMEEP